MRSIPLTACLALMPVLAPVVPAAVGQVSQPAPAKPATPPQPVAPGAPQEGLPTGTDLFAKHVAAIGGEAALRAEKHRVTRFKQVVEVNDQTLTGTITVNSVAPDRMYMILDFPGIFTVETWCDSENGWERNSNSGIKRLEGEQLAVRKRGAHFLGEADYKNRYKTLTTMERTTFADRPAYSVKAVSTEDAPSTLFFDADKGFLIGIRTTESTGERTVTFYDYKQYGSTMQAGKTVQVEPSMRITTEILSLNSGGETPPNVEPPAEVKAVK